MAQAQTISATQLSPQVSTRVPPASPVLGYATPAGAADAVGWQGKDLVMSSGTSIADRCIRCNAPSDGKPIRRNLTWFSPLLYIFLIAGGPLIFGLFVLLCQKRATIHVGLCEGHRARRRKMVFVAWAIALGSVGSFFVAGAIASMWRVESGYLMLPGIVGLLGAIVFGVVLLQQLGYAKHIDAPFVWVRGVNRGYPSRNNRTG